MREWKEYKLSELMELVGGGTPKTSIPEYWGGDIPWLSVTDFNNGKKFCFDAEKKITERGLSESNTKLLKKGQIIIPARGTVGVISVLGRDMAFNQSSYGIDAMESITCNGFLYYLLKDNIANFHSASYGAVFDTITKETFNQIVVILPPLPEQRAIVSVLSSLDDKIDLLHRQNKTLEAMAETLFRQWFVEEADKGWDSVRVGNFVHTNVASINKNNALKTIRYLDTGSLTEGKIDGYQTLDIADAPSRARRIVKHNDVLISTVRPNQKHYGILKNPAEDVIASTGFCVITCDKINPHFIYILLTTDEMTEYLHSIAEGSTSTYPSLKPSDIKGVEFQLPPHEKLDAFSEYADNAWSKIEYNHTQIRTLEKLRDTLLPKLVSGEVRVEYKNN
ncbi:MAG: restriction endonuclease subunit S [Methanosarcinaceae archaeon]